MKHLVIKGKEMKTTSYFYSGYIYKNGKQIHWCDGIIELTCNITKENIDDVRESIAKTMGDYTKDSIHLLTLNKLED
jgi:hypothetical protein